MPYRDIIVIGASAGGIGVLRETLLPALPADLPATVFALVHRPLLDESKASKDLLVGVLGQRCRLPVTLGYDGAKFERGRVYVAPAGRRMCISADCIRIEPTPSELSLYEIDTLFRTAASSHGPRLVAVVLSGMLRDGTAGLWDVRSQGGITVVQDPNEAEHASMPRSAMYEAGVHRCLPAAEIARFLVRLATDEDAVPALPRARVLIVEDERVIAATLEKHLTALSYEVVGSTSSGLSALELAPLLAPDVVLMDIQLAGAMTGTQAAQRLWQQLRVPIVFTTGYCDEGTVSSAKAAMPYGFVVKPYNTGEIHAAIQLALDRRERERQPL